MDVVAFRWNIVDFPGRDFRNSHITMGSYKYKCVENKADSKEKLFAKHCNDIFRFFGVLKDLDPLSNQIS